MSEFKWFFDWNFGNCYMFDTSKRVFTAGNHGSELNMELFLGMDKITPIISDVRGFQIMVLNQSEHKYFSYFFQSYRVKPMSDTAFSIKRNFVTKLPYPYSSCTLDLRTASVDSVDSDLYRMLFDRNLTYSRFHCFRTAYRVNVYEQCGCVLELGDIPGVTHICTNDTENACDKHIYYNLYLNDFYGAYDKDCPLECNSFDFDIIIDAQDFPTSLYAQQLMETHPYFNEVANMTAMEVSESVLRVSVYYRDIGYSNLEEVATYTLNDMIGSTGGMLGLFLGISLISFLEIIELIAEVILC